MEEEIDLRPYIEALIKRWYWIVGAALVLGLIGFGVSYSSPPNYQATALVAVVSPRSIIEFDERIQATTGTQPLRAFPQLALSDQVLQELLAQEPIEGITTIASLRQKMKAEEGKDLSVIGLTVTSQNPAEAADLANAWAGVFVDWANDIYGNQNDEQVLFFETQLAEAETELAATEEALVNYQAIDRTHIISNTLQTYIDSQADYLSKQQQVQLLIQDAGRFRDQINGQITSNTTTNADQLTALLLQLKAFNAVTAVPLQLQISPNDALSSQNQADLIANLNSILDSLSTQSAQIEADLAALEPRILNAQAQLQEAHTEYKRLVRNQVVAQETYISLARKVAEERITSQDTSSGIRLASVASIPSSSTGFGPILAAFLCGIIGGLIAVFVIFFLEWRSRGRTPAN